jgi:amino acid adenylation domain-containing protein
MTVQELLLALAEQGVTLWADGDQLGVRAPKNVVTAELRGLLEQRKRELLGLLRQEYAQTTRGALPRLKADPERRYEPFPLTDIQQAYWVGRSGLIELGHVAPHAYLEIESENLDLDRLARAWRRLVERHDMLRAVVLPTGQQQVLRSVPSYEIKVTDFRGLDPEAADAELRAIREAMSHDVSPADRWPMFDIRGSLLDGGVTRLHFSLDSLVCDFGSFLLLFEQWHRLYEEPDLSLPPLEMSFRDYVLAQEQREDSEDYRRARDYWFDRLDTLPPGPDLPLASQPGTLREYRVQRHGSRLDRQSWQRLKQRARDLGLTPSGILMAAFADVLTAWSANPRFSLNLTLYNRLPLHPQVNEILGNSISVTLLEIDNSQPDSFLARAQRIHRQLLRDLDHQAINGVRILRELARRRGTPQRAIMPVVFTSILGLDSFGLEGLAFHKLGKVVYSVTQTPQVWLDHQVMEQDGALLFYWDAVSQLFPPGVLDDMFTAYCGLLDRLVGVDSAWSEDRRCLVPAYQLAQRAAVNDTESPVSDEMLHTLFAAGGAHHPESPAVVSPGRSLTYRELSGLCNQVGRRLRRWGAVPNTLVAVVMEKGWEQVVATMGILTSGAAYLPVDPQFPRDHRWHLLQQGQVGVVLTQARLDQTLEWPEGIRRCCVDGDDFADEDPAPLEPVQTAGDLAYVLFTSGSTGQPKGAMLPHRGPVQTVVDVNRRFHIGSNDRVLALSALNFDLSVYDIFGTLAAGGTIVVPEAQRVKDPAHWLELMAQYRVTVWNSVPALMEMLLAYLPSRPQALPEALRLVLLSGDVIPVGLPDQIRSRWPRARVISAGGPTETSIWNICYPIDKLDPAWTRIPYGKPLTNQRYHVLSDLLEPRPTWVPGQLYAEGIGLAKGYWRDEEKTRACFISHPRTGSRLYNTGDVGRYLPDGNIDILGRSDFQLKIHGYRIEPGEISAVLEQHPAVREAVVVVVKGDHGQPGLRACVVLHPSQSRGAAAGGVPSTLAEAGEFQRLGDVLVDPAERVAFKLSQPGLRPPDAAKTSVSLPRPAFDKDLQRAYLERQTYRQFLQQPVDLTALGHLLGCLLQRKLERALFPKYRYPSAGGLYPVQTYLHARPGQVEGLAGGNYYYDSVVHRLVLLSVSGDLTDRIEAGANRAILEQSGFILFLTGRTSAIAPMYGKLARDFCLLEAGYMGQLLMQESPQYQIGLCPIGHLELQGMHKLFDLQEDDILVHSFAGGKIDPAQCVQWLQSGIPHPAGVSGPELRDYLRQKLPGYMVPSEIVLLDKLPRTANGKIDRKALAEAPLRPAEAQPSRRPPRTDAEKSLAEIVCDVLRLETVDVHSNFFDLGATSLHLVQIHRKLKDCFGREVPVVEMFRYPTVGFLASYMVEEQPMDRSLEDPHDRARKQRDYLARQQELMLRKVKS